MFKTSARAVMAWGAPGTAERVGSVGLSPPRAGTCQCRCDAHHRVPSVTSSCPCRAQGAGSDGQRHGLAMGKRGQALSGRRTAMVALPTPCIGPLVALLCFFCSYGANKAGVPPGRAPRNGGVGPGTFSEDRAGGPAGWGVPSGDSCSWGAVGTPTSPRPDPLADALRDPVPPASSDCPAAAGLFQHRLQ